MRIYGKLNKISEGYFEVPYKEYRPDGSLKATGSEDFTADRLHSQTHYYSIRTWDGQRRNAGGYRWFEDQGSFRVDSRQGLKEYAARQYPEAELIDIRKLF